MPVGLFGSQIQTIRASTSPASGCEGFEIEALAPHRHAVHASAPRDRDELVEVERRGRLHHSIARPQEGTRERADEPLRSMAGDDARRRRADEPADLDPKVVVRLDRIQRRVRELVARGVEHPRQRTEEVLVPVELGALRVVAERSYLGDGSLDVERLELADAGNHEAAPVGHAATLRIVERG